MKNNFITKIIGATLAFAMMIGGAVGINAVKQAKEVNAAATTVSWAGSTALPGTATAIAGDTNVTIKTSSTNSYTSPMRIYANTTITIQAQNNCYLKSVTYEASSTGNYVTYAQEATVSPSVTPAVSGKNVTWTMSGTSVTTFTFKPSSQTRANSISVTYDSNNSGGQGPVALDAPDPQYDSDANKVTWSPVDHATGYQVSVNDENHYDDATSPYDGNFVAGTNYTVYVKAIGDGVDYSDSEAGSVPFTAVAPFDGKVYARCTSVSDLEAGASYLITNGVSGTVKTMSKAESDNNRPAIDINVVNSKITSTRNALTLTLGGTSGAWTLQTENYEGTDGYLASSSSNDKNHCRVISDETTGTISFGNNNKAVITLNPHDTRNVLQYNSSSSYFACYGTAQGDIYLWKEYKELDHLSVTGELEKTSYYDTEEFNSAGLTISAVYNNSSSRVLAANEVDWEPLTAGMTQIRGSYTENNITKYTQYFSITVAADSLSSVTLSGTMGANYYLDSEWDPGTLAVTANYASNIHVTVTNDATIAYYSDSAMNNEVATPADLGVGANQTIYVKATYNTVSNASGYAQTVTVSIEPGTTEANAFTVAAAVEFGMNNLEHTQETTKQYYIQGVVSQIVENNLNTNNKKATFWLQNGNVEQGFEAYQIAPAAGCTNYNDFRVGSEVLIKCQIKRYNSIIETGTAKSLLSITYTAPQATGITLNSTSLNIEINDTFQLTPTLSPLGAEGNISWSSNDELVATVSDSGLVTGVAKGSAKITAQVSENVKAECNVIVAEQSRSMSNKITADLTSVASVDNDDFEINFEANKQTGYYQDGSVAVGTTRYFTVQSTSPLFACEPSSIILKATLGGGSAKDELVNNVEACLVDADGNNIESTKRAVATGISNSTGSEYSVALPYSPNAYGFKLMHAKESGYNVRFYSFSLSYKYSDTFAALSGNETNEGVEQVKMTFGETISVDTWNDLESSLGTITDYGVMMFKTTSALSSNTPVQDRFKVNGALANFHKGSGEISPDSDVYKFSAYVSFSDNTKYGTTVCAATYIVAGGVYYFLGEAQYSVNTLAQYHLQNGGSNLSTEALNALAGN